jgi:hypothetical protein
MKGGHSASCVTMPVARPMRLDLPPPLRHSCVLTLHRPATVCVPTRSFVSDVDMRHKVNTFILKNPPENKLTKEEKR